AWPARNFGTLRALIWMGAPVRGLRPCRALRLPTKNEPKPTSVTISPFFSEPLIELTVASNARPAAALEISACLAIASISSDLFTGAPFRCEIEIRGGQTGDLRGI